MYFLLFLTFYPLISQPFVFKNCISLHLMAELTIDRKGITKCKRPQVRLEPRPLFSDHLAYGCLLTHRATNRTSHCFRRKTQFSEAKT